MAFSESSLTRIAFIILAVSLCIGGLGIFIDGGHYSERFGYYFDFGGHPSVAGVVFFVLGLWCAYCAFRRGASS